MRTLRGVAALTAAVKLCRASTLGVPHGETRAWLLKIAPGILTPNRGLPAHFDRRFGVMVPARMDDRRTNLSLT
jgi:hypothetical protein